MSIKNKVCIRQETLKKRREMPPEEVILKSTAAQKAFLESDLYKAARQIMVYMPLGNETDTKMIIKQAFTDGKKLVFPVTGRETGEITPCIADEKTRFVKGNFSVYEPEMPVPADMQDTDIVLVPGVAFDKKGARVGFGKGCYDRLLKKYNVTKAGFCYEHQVWEKIEAEPHDIKMDYIITEKGIFKCRN